MAKAIVSSESENEPVTESSLIKLRPAQIRRFAALNESARIAQQQVQSFYEYLRDDLEVPDGWVLNDMYVGFTHMIRPSASPILASRDEPEHK